MFSRKRERTDNDDNVLHGVISSSESELSDDEHSVDLKGASTTGEHGFDSVMERATSSHGGNVCDGFGNYMWRQRGNRGGRNQKQKQARLSSHVDLGNLVVVRNTFDALFAAGELSWEVVLARLDGEHIIIELAVLSRHLIVKRLAFVFVSPYKQIFAKGALRRPRKAQVLQSTCLMKSWSRL